MGRGRLKWGWDVKFFFTLSSSFHFKYGVVITLFRVITMLCGTHNIPRNILWRMLVPHNIVTNLNNVMVNNFQTSD